MLNYIDEPPSQRALKHYFIDKNIEHFPQKTLNCVAYMILTFDDPEEMMDVALADMVDELGACRADMGYLTSKDKLYNPSSIHYSRYSSPSDCTDVAYSNQTKVFQKAWRRRTAVTSINIHDDKIMSDSRDIFEAIQTESILFQRLSLGGKMVGLTCIDFTKAQHVWTPAEVTFISEFCRSFLGPLAGISQYWHGSKKE
jgi:GAF domain-containing protein